MQVSVEYSIHFFPGVLILWVWIGRTYQTKKRTEIFPNRFHEKNYIKAVFVWRLLAILKGKNNNLMPCTSLNKKSSRTCGESCQIFVDKSRESCWPITIYWRLFALIDIMTQSGVVRDKRFACNKEDTREEFSNKRQVSTILLIFLSAHSCNVLLLNKWSARYQFLFKRKFPCRKN